MGASFSWFAVAATSRQFALNSLDLVDTRTAVKPGEARLTVSRFSTPLRVLPQQYAQAFRGWLHRGTHSGQGGNWRRWRLARDQEGRGLS